MVRYSPEPPRTHLAFHYTFNEPDNTVIRDRGAFANDGSLVGTPSDQFGTVGQTLSFNGNDDGIRIDRLSPQVSDNQTFTVSLWARKRRETGNEETILSLHDGQIEVAIGPDGTIYGRFTDDQSTTHETSYMPPEPLAWHHIVLRYDGDTDEQLTLHVGGQEVDLLTESRPVANVDGVSSVAYAAHSSDRYFTGSVDDVRAYTVALSVDQIENLHSIGADHNSRLRVRDAWPSAAMPLVRDENNSRFVNALVEEKDYYFRELDAVLQARHVEDASGRELERIGRGFGIRRKNGEDDDKYRARIIANLSTARSNGTFRDIVETTAKIVDRDVRDIVVERNDAAIAVAEIYVPTAAIDALGITASELSTILQDVVVAGHNVDVFAVGAEPFTLTDDATPNDPSLGLTSDSIQTGGGLIEDI